MALINLLVQSKNFFNITPRTGEVQPDGALPLFANKWIEDFTEAQLETQASMTNALKQTVVDICDAQGLNVDDQKFQFVISTQLAPDPIFFSDLFNILPQAAFIVMIDFQSQPSGFLPNPN